MNAGSFPGLAALLVLCVSVSANAAEFVTGQSAPIAMEELAARLDLDASQQARIAPAVQERNERLEALTGKAGASRREKLQVLREARTIQQDFISKVSPVLTKEQNAEWSQLRDETREQISGRQRRK